MLLLFLKMGVFQKKWELTQFKPCNYGTSVCVINHRSDFDQITWTNNGYNCQNKQITYHIQFKQCSHYYIPIYWYQLY